MIEAAQTDLPNAGRASPERQKDASILADMALHKPVDLSPQHPLSEKAMNPATNAHKAPLICAKATS